MLFLFFIHFPQVAPQRVIQTSVAVGPTKNDEEIWGMEEDCCFRLHQNIGFHQQKWGLRPKSRDWTNKNGVIYTWPRKTLQNGLLFVRFESQCVWKPWNRLFFFRYPDFWKVTHILLKLFVPGIDHWVGNRHEYSIVLMCTYVYTQYIYIIYRYNMV